MVINLHARFRREGIEMPYPTRTVRLAEPLRAPAAAARPG
jgi:small-conductance mechanosensitive channel